MAASVPCPSASGAKVKTRNPLRRPPTAGTSSSSQGRTGLHRLRPRRRLPARVVGVVARQGVQGVVNHDLTGRVEDDGPEAREDAHDQRQPQQPGLGTEPPAAQLPELGEPAEWMGRGGMRRRLILHGEFPPPGDLEFRRAARHALGLSPPTGASSRHGRGARNPTRRGGPVRCSARIGGRLKCPRFTPPPPQNP